MVSEIATSSIDIKSIRQECTVEYEYSEFFECIFPFDQEVEKIVSGLPDDVLNILADLIANYELPLEEKAEQAIEILGEPGFCTPEFLELLPRLVFCFLDCEEGFCLANEADVQEVLTLKAAQFGCETDVENVCEDFFGEVTGEAEWLVGVGLAGMISFLGTVGFTIEH
eukprot:snap_masked-scaffold_22-processed-gene-0.17-mRNA-1 protein AED:1.00 eAED:1.00 QI:0/-1/0/0/-1/1/1/0/168